MNTYSSQIADLSIGEMDAVVKYYQTKLEGCSDNELTSTATALQASTGAAIYKCHIEQNCAAGVPQWKCLT